MRNFLQSLLPFTAKLKWRSSINAEIAFWDRYFASGGLQWKDRYHERLNPNWPLQARPKSCLNEVVGTPKILDVGAGPLTYLGKQIEGKPLDIIAIDPLAKQYNKILSNYGISPVVRTITGDGEKVHKMFSPSTFDLVFARNCIDHSYNPEKAILNMLEVTKPGAYVLLEHRPNEAITENYQGLHQWNFSCDENGDFIIGSKMEELNFSLKYRGICNISTEMIDSKEEDGEWLICWIRKK